MRSGVAIGDVEVHEALVLDALHEVVGADDIGAGFLGLARGVARCEHGDTDVLTGARGQRHGPAQHLVGLAGIHAEAERSFDGFVELAVGELLHQLERLLRLVDRRLVVTAAGVDVLLTLGHCSLLRRLSSLMVPVVPPARCSGGGHCENEF